MGEKTELMTVDNICNRVYVVRGQQVMLDYDLDTGSLQNVLFLAKVEHKYTASQIIIYGAVYNYKLFIMNFVVQFL